jgi:GNAT superfamily N-acetyltransferase/predicted nucleic acid-binding protein
MSNGIRLERSAVPADVLERIIALHRASAGTLGFFPKGAFEEHAKLGQIIVALNANGDCLGYLLYRVARGRVAIVHLCVSEQARGRGVSRLLVERLKLDTKALEGIGLHCRRDYDAHHLWPKFGFEAVNSKPGRGADGATLTYWWFSHGHDDLLSRISEPDPIRQRVVVDANVFFDLHGRDTPESEVSKALLADWVQASIELVVTKELSNEIANGPDEESFRRSRAALTGYPKLRADDAVFQRLCGELHPHFPESVTLRDEADLRQVAYAIAGGAPFFVTRDQTLIDRCETLYASQGLTVLHPSELINHLDAVERESDYRPARIEGSRLRNTLLRTEALDTIVEHFKRADERENEFRKVLLHHLSQPRTTEAQVITDQSNGHVLLGVTIRDQPSVLAVPVLRPAQHTMASTMLRNFLRATLAAASAEKRSVVTILEPRLTAEHREVLREFGFIECGDAWAKVALRASGKLAEIQRAVAGLDVEAAFAPAKDAALTAISAVDALPHPLAILAIERQLWPAKVTETEMPTFIVSIRPQWAQHFFDVELGSQLLFGLREDLHLGVDGVYYRSAKNNNLTAPGRVLWYVSQGDGLGSMTIKACSHIEEVVIGKPKDLFRRFQRLGVLQWPDVYAVAGHNVATDVAAFRFRMTERFPQPVGTDKLETLGIRGPFMSPRQISDAQFTAIYKHGCGLT